MVAKSNKILEQQVNDLNPWYQCIDFGNGIITNDSTTGTAEQVYQDIRSFLFENLELTRFLDIGCSAGYFITRLILDGANNCRGIDINPNSIKQANLVKSYFLKNKKDHNIKLICDKYEDFLTNEPHTTRYHAIIASSVLYPRTFRSTMDEEFLKDYFYVRAKLLTDKTWNIIARWRNENNCRNGDIFYEQLQKFGFHENGRKELCNRTLVRYQKTGNLRLANNHHMVFDDYKTRGWNEIITVIAGCKNLRLWNRLDKTKRKDLSNFITYVSPKTLTYRNFLKNNIYNSNTEMEFLENHKPKLFKSIKEIGIEQPPVIREKKNGLLLVDDGNHRVGISNCLKFDKIPVIILKEY